MLILHLSIVLLLIIVNGFFAMAEIALVSARKARLAACGGRQSRRASGARTESGSFATALDRPDRGHRHRRPLRHLRSGHIGRAARAAARDLSRVCRAICACDQHGGRRDRHLVFLADPGRTRAQAHRAAPSRAHRRRARPHHAGDRTGGSADRMVFERLDQSRAPPDAAAQPRSRTSDRRGDQFHAARRCRDRAHTRKPRPQSSRWRCDLAIGGRAR